MKDVIANIIPWDKNSSLCLVLKPEERMESSGRMTHIFEIKIGYSLHLAFLELETLGTISVNILNYELCKFPILLIHSPSDTKAHFNFKSRIRHSSM